MWNHCPQSQASFHPGTLVHVSASFYPLHWPTLFSFKRGDFGMCRFLCEHNLGFDLRILWAGPSLAVSPRPLAKASFWTTTTRSNRSMRVGGFLLSLIWAQFLFSFFPFGFFCFFCFWLVKSFGENTFEPFGFEVVLKFLAILLGYPS
jgi:hypothetical protein